MKSLRVLILAALCLTAPAAAQVNQSNICSNCVVGRLGIGTGPAQAIPFATLQSALGGISLSGNNTFTATNNFTGTFQLGGVALTAPGSGLLVGATDTQTLTNKSIDGSEITSGTISPSFVGPINLASGGNGGVIGALAVGVGGTGQSSLTANGVVVGEGTSGVHIVATNTGGLCLTSNVGQDPSWGSCAAGSSVSPGAYITVNGATVAAPFVASTIYHTFGGL